MQQNSRYQPRPKYTWSILSVAAVLFLVALFSFLTLHAQQFLDQVKEDFQLVIELAPETTEKEREEVVAKLQKEEGVESASVTFISKEAGLKELSKDLGAEIIDLDLPNPLSDVIQFNMYADHLSSQNMHSIKKQYEDLAVVTALHYQQELVDQLIYNLDRLKLAVMGVGILLLLLALMMIHNTIRLAIWANRFLLKSMELVGASWSFIRRPFLRKSFRHALISGAIALGALALVGFALMQEVPSLAQYLEIEHVLTMVAIIFVAGILINVLSTWIVVTRFLKMRTNELHT